MSTEFKKQWGISANFGFSLPIYVIAPSSAIAALVECIIKVDSQIDISYVSDI
jgi:hypothetical protein